MNKRCVQVSRLHGVERSHQTFGTGGIGWLTTDASRVRRTISSCSRRTRRDETAGINQFLVALGLIVVFTSGGTQIGLATGPLEAVFETDLQLSSISLLALGGGGILLGAWIRGPRLVRAVSNEYATLGARRSIAALIPTFLIAQLAIVLGIPISFNKVMIASIVGSGLAASSSDGSGVSPRKVGIALGSWLGSIPGAGVISYGLYNLLNAVPGVG